MKKIKDLFYICLIHGNKTMEEEDEDMIKNIKIKFQIFFIAKLFKGATKHKNDLSTYDIVYYIYKKS